MACSAADGHFQVVPAYRADPSGNQAHNLLPGVRCRDEAREASPCGDQSMAGSSRARVSGIQVAPSAPCLNAQLCEPTIPSLFEGILIFGALHSITENTKHRSACKKVPGNSAPALKTREERPWVSIIPKQANYEKLKGHRHDCTMGSLVHTTNA